MAAYARRHYDIDTWKLVDPKVIVEHFTGGSSFSSAWNTFAANGPDLGELPGTCAHFIIDTDGTIYQLVPLSIMCRHTVGLNWTSVGIEDVGTSDAEILHNTKQLAASLHLTLWHPAAQRHRPQREPHQPVPSRVLSRMAVPDTLRLEPRGHADVSAAAGRAAGSLRHPPGPTRQARLDVLFLMSRREDLEAGFAGAG
jgi:hypothetical protein